MPGIVERDESGQEIKQLISDEMIEAEERNGGQVMDDDLGEDMGEDVEEVSVEWSEKMRDQINASKQSRSSMLMSQEARDSLAQRSEKNLQKPSRAPSGKLLETVSIDPKDVKKRAKLRKQMKSQIVKKTEATKDPYANKEKQKAEFMKKIKKELKSFNSDPKNVKQMQKLTSKQLNLLQNEQLRQLYVEREVLKKQAEEVKRLEWLHNNVDNSHGLKNRHDPL